MLVVRAPNHLGDLVMALPALQQAQPDLVIAPKALTSLVQLAGFNALPYTSPFDIGAQMRKQRFDRGILLTPSFSSALTFSLGLVKERRGTNTDRRGFLLTNKVDAQLLEHTHRSSVYWFLCTGEMPEERPIPKLKLPEQLKSDFENLLHPHSPTPPHPDTPTPRIGVFPGSNALARRWGADRFVELVRTIGNADGTSVVVFGGPDERDLTRYVAGEVGIDMGGKTTLPLLAAGLQSCDLVISNDSGPLHLAAAVGARTVSMWGAGDPARTGPPPGHVILRDTRLPCLECVKNQCPRRGPGYILPEAYMECMQLISVGEVINRVAV